MATGVALRAFRDLKIVIYKVQTLQKIFETRINKKD